MECLTASRRSEAYPYTETRSGRERFTLCYSQAVYRSTSFGWCLLVFQQFHNQPLQKSDFQSAICLNVAFRLQHSARNQLFTILREGVLQTAPLDPEQGWCHTPDHRGVWCGPGLGTESRSVDVQGAAASRGWSPVRFWVLHCQAVLMHTPKLLSTQVPSFNLVLGDYLSASPFWLSPSILFLLSTPPSLEAQLPSSDFISGRAPTSVLLPAD